MLNNFLHIYIFFFFLFWKVSYFWFSSLFASSSNFFLPIFFSQTIAVILFATTSVIKLTGNIFIHLRLQINFWQFHWGVLPKLFCRFSPCIFKNIFREGKINCVLYINNMLSASLYTLLLKISTIVFFRNKKLLASV